MNELYYTIAPEIFEKFPGFARGVVLAYDVKNGASSAALIEMLREAESSVRSNVNLETIAEHARIKPWREAFKAFGAKPSEFRSSIEAMARRALRNDPIPSINALVDIGNIISLRHLIPAGGHSLDALTEDLELKLATGGEDFIALGSTENEHPLAGEVIFAEGNTVLTRRWVWRQGTHTLTLPETTQIEFNL
ncbi:MAG: cytoplasmic protein, partial [Anaerolineaceae bacterium]|nr:cytoplasmic protein [Anaerolineaceae bacterium]